MSTATMTTTRPGSLSLAGLTRRLADAVSERELTVRLLLCGALLLVLATTTTLALMAAWGNGAFDRPLR